jgi:hypothetical protein
MPEVIYVIDERVPREPGPEIVYKWEVGKVKDNRQVPDGEYKVEVCESGTNNCDMSDDYFRIVSVSSKQVNFLYSKFFRELYHQVLHKIKAQLFLGQ